MEQYQNLIGVVLEKMDQTYKDLTFNFDGLSAILNSHSVEENSNTPELITISDLRACYEDLIKTLENRFPGIKTSTSKSILP
jgi:hypothetical protein